MKASPLTDLWADKRRLMALLVVASAALIVGAAGMYIVNRAWLTPGVSGQVKKGSEHGGEDEHGDEDGHGEEEESTTVTLPKEKWEIAELRVQQVERGTLSGSAWVTGKLSLNEDRTSHIYSLADGQVHEVKVQFGDDVKQGQTLAVIDSKEVGSAKLELHKTQLDAEFAKLNNEWAQKISTNTQELIKALAAQAPLDSIDETFADKPMGDYRQQLMTSYASLYKSTKDLERLEPLANQGVAAGKQLLEAKSTYEADRATFQALMEQLKFTTWQQALLKEQELRQAEQAVAASRSRLYILGYKQADLQSIDPLKEGEAIAHYEIRAPFDGTVIGKNVVLAERVGPDTEMFQVADLSTLWVQADIYQKDLPKLDQLGDTLRFRAPNTDHDHTAKIFYMGDVLDPDTRTARLRAAVENPQRHLKPGMFVEVALPGESILDVITIPASALQEIEGKDVVFVQTAEDKFQMRNVVIGARNDGVVQIHKGLQAGEPVVVSGGFTLKSELMKGSISHGH
ncbi:MAG: efflux RND transporter periplasmic adaptor subunit [Planctomycetaceae bacterium]|nr:efflux RND transporter periplasmic adaptor subunit [Planctomycetales bacterium]MCB9920971.1 efflux RND transporter periplasmic adaptor subunit [Planctomycetaceae bacterium]